MLSLTRKAGETIVATTERGERITFTVLHCKPSQARVCVVAPQSVRVDREEIDQKRQKEACHDQGY